MYLFKCKCGSIFTINHSLTELSVYIKCPNCGENTRVHAAMNCDDFKQSLASIGMTLQIIPDDAKITVSFES